ncbi:MAG: hypothetical protein ACRDZZ_05700 [Ilumatobacteraceae bacterium]
MQKAVRLGVAVAALLQNEEVRRALGGASRTVRDWAQNRRDQRSDRTHGRQGPITRVSERFGQGALERRVDSLADVIPEIEAVSADLAANLHTVETDLRRALTVAGRMPTTPRWRAQREIVARLDKIEKSLIDVVLAPR